MLTVLKVMCLIGPLHLSLKSQSAVFAAALKLMSLCPPFPGMTEDTVCVGVARLGSDEQKIRVGTLNQLVSCDLGVPLHSLVITGRLHPLEVDMLRVNAEPNALENLHMIDSSTYTS